MSQIIELFADDSGWEMTVNGEVAASADGAFTSRSEAEQDGTDYAEWYAMQPMCNLCGGVMPEGTEHMC